MLDIRESAYAAAPQKTDRVMYSYKLSIYGEVVEHEYDLEHVLIVRSSTSRIGFGQCWGTWYMIRMYVPRMTSR